MPVELNTPPRLTRISGPRPGIGIVHFGLGAFFRAHVGLYIEEAMAASGGDWGVIGVSLVRPDQHDRLAPQDCAYTAVELGPDGETSRVVNVVQDVIVARENTARLLDLLSDPGIRIVTLTITEKGYCHEPASGALNFDHPDIIHDLAHPDAPRTALGYIVRGLARRRALGVPPFTVMTCDNLPQNGRMVRGVVLEFARAVDPALADWIAQEGRFPATMVDRIVPATSQDDIERLAARTGVFDAAPVFHEPFRQWVIEDDFVGGARPDFAATDAELVQDVTPFEDMKLRCLNGSHSTLAYLGYLAGHETIAEAVSDPVLARFVRQLWTTEVIPSIDAPPGVDLAAYTDALFARYSNPAIRHRTWQIAMDGSQKLPQRILATLADNLAARRESPGLTLAVAAWMRYVGGVDEQGAAIDVRDPMARRLRALSDAAPDAEAKVAAFLALQEVFSETLARSPEFAAALTRALVTLEQHGARAAAAKITS